jgi:hypothetical protein
MNAPLNVPHALCACEKRGGKLKDKCSQRGQELCLCCAVLKDLGGPDRLFTLLPASKLTTGSVCQVAVVSKFRARLAQLQLLILSEDLEELCQTGIFLN